MAHIWVRDILGFGSILSPSGLPILNLFPVFSFPLPPKCCHPSRLSSRGTAAAEPAAPRRAPQELGMRNEPVLRRVTAALLAHSILFTFATENISSAPVTRTAPNVKSHVVCLPFNNPWNPLIRIPLSLRNNTYLRACVLSHLRRVRLFETLWFLYPWDSPGQNTGVGCHARLRRSSPPRDRTRVSYVSCIGRRVLYHFLYH